MTLMNTVKLGDAQEDQRPRRGGTQPGEKPTSCHRTGPQMPSLPVASHYPGINYVTDKQYTRISSFKQRGILIAQGISGRARKANGERAVRNTRDKATESLPASTILQSPFRHRHHSTTSIPPTQVTGWCHQTQEVPFGSENKM